MHVYGSFFNIEIALELVMLSDYKFIHYAIQYTNL
jgi:hypothetical protein